MVAVRSFGSHEDAVRLAHFAHADQVDKAGKSYVGHVLRVADRVKDSGGSSDSMTAAVLHDVLEDTVISAQMLRDLGFSRRVVEIVDLLTRTIDRSHEDYYARIAEDPDALLVKAADIDDNTDPERTRLLDPQLQMRLAEKYAAAKFALGL